MRGGGRAAAPLHHPTEPRRQLRRRQVVREALARVPERMLVVPYDELEWLREHHWAKILGFVRGGAAAAQSSLPVFRSGNRMWLDRSKVADLWALSPPLTLSPSPLSRRPPTPGVLSGGASASTRSVSTTRYPTAPLPFSPSPPAPRKK